MEKKEALGGRVMEKKEAKERSLRLWTWLADHPGKGKKDYPLYEEEVKGLAARCSLCDYFIKHDDHTEESVCRLCPLHVLPGGTCGTTYNKWSEGVLYPSCRVSWFKKWMSQRAARWIRDAIAGWEVEEPREEEKE